MRKVIYTLEFKGSAAPKPGAAGVLKAATTAAGCTLTTSFGPEGVTGSLRPVTGDVASFESEVTLTGDDSFLESGTIRFGSGNHQISFSTVGHGSLVASPIPNLQQGAVIWRVEGGKGQFEGAQGLITSNFTISADGEVVDHHFGAIFVI
jgi:hypothetical protein